MRGVRGGMTRPADDDLTLGRGLQPGDHHYRAFIDFPDKYDIGAATQFSLLTALGLREDHFLLDIGCGSLRAGRLFIVYLRPGRYFGIEPERWLVEEGIRLELGREILAVKRPTFGHNRDFTLSAFGRQFDFLLAQSVFSHSAPRQVRRCLAEARAVMSPTAIFIATYWRPRELHWRRLGVSGQGPLHSTRHGGARAGAGAGVPDARLGTPVRADVDCHHAPHPPRPGAASHQSLSDGRHQALPAPSRRRHARPRPARVSSAAHRTDADRIPMIRCRECGPGPPLHRRHRPDRLPAC
jgi:SAM-dependent methyltransferase